MPSVLLTPFQKEKLEYYFRFLSPDQNGNLTEESIDILMEKILDFTGWDEDSAIAKECREVHLAFFEILLEKVNDDETVAAKNHVSLESWFSMWSNLLPGVMGMHNFPVWLRLMPKILFTIVDRRRQGYLTAVDLEIFYKEMVQLSPEQAASVAKTGYEQMTDHGRYPLDVSSYEQLFANFLIGRTPYGPGRFIFGCFEHQVQPFQLIQPAPEPGDEIMEVRHVSTGRRPSRQLVSFT